MTEIRAATEADEDGLRQLDRATRTRYSSFGVTEPDPPFFRDDQRPGNTLVAEAGDQLVGYIRLGRPTQLPENRHVFTIHGLAVHPDHRRMGIAQQLLDAAAGEAARRGARRLTLRVMAPNETARALYRRAGFEEEGVLRGEFRVGDEYVDDVLMARRLGG